MKGDYNGKDISSVFQRERGNKKSGGESGKTIALTCPNCGSSLSVEEGREFTYCEYCGTKVLIHDDSKQTIILHGHHDTVQVDDFGSIKEFAFDCDALPEKIKAITSDPEVLADIESGEWMFGRGASDMKSGNAVNLALLRYFTEHLDQFDGNLIFMATMFFILCWKKRFWN